MSWERVSIPILGLLEITATMQLFVNTSDKDPNKNITEAAFDRFSVTNFSLAELNEHEKKIMIYPNPFEDELRVTNLEVGKNLILFDQNGRILFQKIADKSDEIICLSFLQKGSYFLKIDSRVYKVIKG
jgi:hypothetical protein